MSHSTEIEITVGLDSFKLHCGCRQAAVLCGVHVNSEKVFTDDQALSLLVQFASNGVGRYALLGLIQEQAMQEKSLYEGYTDGMNWLTITVGHYG